MEEYEDDASKRVGTLIAGKWRVERVLGVGGMASVVLARTPDGAAAAIKILHADVNAIPELRTRFLREAPIAKALQEPVPIPGIVRMLEVGEDTDGTAYIAMEAVAGETLFDRVAREATLSVTEALEITEQVLDVLVVAHERGVVHRDLKPENIHVGIDGRVRVLDFGIARILDALPRNIDGLPEKTPTRTGVIMGTAAYMAPEQATGLVSEIDVRTDLFSLGATMFRMLAGRTVHGPLTDTLELIAAATEKAEPLATFAPTLSVDVCSVVDRALAFMKPYRYPDAETMRGDVRALMRGAPPPYLRAVAGGRIAAGDHPPVEATRADADPVKPPAPHPVEPTRIDPEPVGPTLPDPPRPGPTLNDGRSNDGRSNFRVLAFTIAAVALVAGVSAGIGLATCHGRDREATDPDPGAASSPSASASVAAPDGGPVHVAPPPPPAPKKPHPTKPER